MRLYENLVLKKAHHSDRDVELGEVYVSAGYKGHSAIVAKLGRAGPELLKGP